MKNLIYEMDSHHKLYRDSETGIAWMEDHSTGLEIFIHASSSDPGSMREMKERGYWGRNDRVVKSHGRYYNIDTLVCDLNDINERLVAQACRCESCNKRLVETGVFVKNRETSAYTLMFSTPLCTMDEGSILRRGIKNARTANLMHPYGMKYDTDDVIIRHRLVTAGEWK